MKRLILFMLGLLVAFTTQAQFGNFKEVRLTAVTDTSGVAQINGNMYYNPLSNKFRFRQNGTWRDLYTGPYLSLGTNKQIPYTNTGGTGFSYSSSLTYDNSATMLYTPKLTLSGAPSNDDALTQILVRDGSTGEVKYRTSSSLGSFGTTKQIPYTNTTGTGFLYSSNFTYDGVNDNITAAGNLTNTNSGIQDANTTFGQSHQFLGSSNIRWNTAIGEQGIFDASGSVIHNATVIGGFNNSLRTSGSGQIFSSGIFSSNFSDIYAQTANATSSVIFCGRRDTIQNAQIAFASGYRAKVTKDGGFAHGFFTTYSNTSHTGTIQSVWVDGKHGFGFYTNSPSSIAGQGVLADYSFALGGLDPNIPSTSPRSGILGGNGIKARASDPDQIYVPNFNIDSTPLNDDALTQVLVRDGTTGQVKYRAASSLAGSGESTTVSNGLSLTGSLVKLGSLYTSPSTWLQPDSTVIYGHHRNHFGFGGWNNSKPIGSFTVFAGDSIENVYHTFAINGTGMYLNLLDGSNLSTATATGTLNFSGTGMYVNTLGGVQFQTSDIVNNNSALYDMSASNFSYQATINSDIETVLDGHVVADGVLRMYTQQFSASERSGVTCYPGGVLIGPPSTGLPSNGSGTHIQADDANEVALRINENGGTAIAVFDESSNAKRIGFFGVTPSIQATTTTAIDDLLVNYGLRASGGNPANFSRTVQLRAGTATSGTAPLVFTSGTNMTTPSNGAVEYDGTNYYATSGGTRYTVARTLSNTATLDFPSTTSTGVSDLTIAVTGAAVGDAVQVGVPNGSITATASFFAWVSATNTVTVRFSPKATEDPASGTFKVTVTK